MQKIILIFGNLSVMIVESARGCQGESPTKDWIIWPHLWDKISAGVFKTVWISACYIQNVSLNVCYRQKLFVDQICNSQITLSLISATAIFMFAVDLKQPTGIKMGRGTGNIWLIVIYSLVFTGITLSEFVSGYTRLQVMGLDPNSIGNNTKINHFSSFSTTIHW